MRPGFDVHASATFVEAEASQEKPQEPVVRSREASVREALAARSGRDFALSAPPRREREALYVKLLRACLAPLLKHPLRAAGGAIFVGAAGAVAVNALAWQTVRHPSPLFTAAPEAETRSARLRPAPPPIPPARPGTVVEAPTPPVALAVLPQAPRLQRDLIGDMIRTASVPAPRPRDPIGDAIRASETGATNASAKSEPQKTATSAQRALVKLGYGSLKVDGIIGAETRQAIERFERERKIPITGELNPRTVRALSLQSGVPIE
jgi:hypothetical protein